MLYLARALLIFILLKFALYAAVTNHIVAFYPIYAALHFWRMTTAGVSIVFVGIVASVIYGGTLTRRGLATSDGSFMAMGLSEIPENEDSSKAIASWQLVSALPWTLLALML